MYSQTVVVLLPLLCLLVACEDINIKLEANTTCGKSEAVGKDDVASIVATGQLPNPALECDITFTTTECGICFMFEWLAFFNTTLANLTVTVGSDVKNIDFENTFPLKPFCSNETSLAVKVTQHSDYDYNATNPGYWFVLDVYNKCGYRGTAKSLPFNDVVEYAKGYHGDEMESRELKTLLQGLGVGLSLSFIFLVVLGAGYWNMYNKGAFKSAVIPSELTAI